MDMTISNWFKNFLTPQDTSAAYAEFTQMHTTQTQKYLDQDCLDIIKCIEKALKKRVVLENIAVEFNLDHSAKHNETWYLTKLARYVEAEFQHKHGKETEDKPLLSIKINPSSDPCYVANWINITLDIQE